MSLLLVQPLADGGLRWSDGHESGHGPVAELADFARDRRLVLVIDGERVTLTRAQAPRRNRKAWRQALPYALEDGLAEPVEHLHFAIGDPDATGSTPVIVLRARYLQDWLNTLRGVGLNVVAATPDLLLLPRRPGCWSLLVDGPRILVRLDDHLGFVASRDTLPVLMRRALREAAPAGVDVRGELPDLAGLDLDLNRLAPPAESLQLLAAGEITIDLLQGSFQPGAELHRWLRPWHAAALLGGLLVVSQLLDQILEYRDLQHRQQELQAAMVQVYRSAVPDAQRIIDPRAQLAGHLQTLERVGGDGDLLDLLAAGGAVLHRFPELRLQALRYQRGRLELDLEGGQLETLDRLQDQLRGSTRLEVQLRASMRENQVVSRLTLSGAGS